MSPSLSLDNCVWKLRSKCPLYILLSPWPMWRGGVYSRPPLCSWGSTCSFNNFTPQLLSLVCTQQLQTHKNKDLVLELHGKSLVWKDLLQVNWKGKIVYVCIGACVCTPLPQIQFLCVSRSYVLSHPSVGTHLVGVWYEPVSDTRYWSGGDKLRPRQRWGSITRNRTSHSIMHQKSFKGSLHYIVSHPLI